jgi:hypothetical protein
MATAPNPPPIIQLDERAANPEASLDKHGAKVMAHAPLRLPHGGWFPRPPHACKKSHGRA